jgi:hypothetical protein
MKHWKKFAVAAVMVTASASAGIAWAGGGENQAPPGSGAVTSSGGSTRFLGGGITEQKFTAIAPCRLVDTRVHDVPLVDGTSVAYDVRGTGATFGGQGGKFGGCGIPDAGVTAVEITVTAVDATGNGYLRVFPGAEPTATFLNYTDAFNPTNTGTVAVACATGGLCIANRDLTVKNHGHHTDLVIDVQGYYSLPMAGKVNADGTIGRQSRISGVTKLPAPGLYEVRFDRDVTTCTYTAIPDNFEGVNGANAVVAPRSGEATGVYVNIHNQAGAQLNSAFYIEVTC